MTEVTVPLIRTEADYEAALAQVDGLMDAEAGSDAAARLDAVVTMIEAYEARHHAIAAPDPVDLIKHVMEARGLSRSDLQDVLGSSGRVSEILNRKRPLTLAMIRTLSARFGLPAEVLIQEYPLEPADARPRTRPFSRIGRRRALRVAPHKGGKRLGQA